MKGLGLLNQKGAFISNLDPKGPSKAAGLQEGDVILRFNNIEINRMSDLPRVVAESDIGSIATLEIWRKNQIITLKVKLGELPEESYVKRTIQNETENPFFVEILNLSILNNKESNGVKVVEVSNDSNLIKEDTIIEVNREPIENAESFINLVENIYETGRNSLLLRIIRDNKSLWITIKFIR